MQNSPSGPPAFPTGETFEISLTVNDRRETLRIEPRESLLDALREHLGLKGPKKGCNQGACGACTVLADGERILACLALAIQYQGRTITTIEGLGEGDGLHPLQEAFVEHDGLQCGYCTPGQICSALGMLRELRQGVPSAVSPDLSADHFELSDDELRERMSGNLCRCGAYVGIRDAIREVAAEVAAGRSGGGRGLTAGGGRQVGGRSRLHPPSIQDRAGPQGSGRRAERTERSGRPVVKVLRTLLETVARMLPAKEPDPLAQKTGGYVGQPLRRADGPAKAQGRARFTADLDLENLAHAAIVHSSIAKGRVVAIEASAARQAPGFLALLTHENAPRLKAPHRIHVLQTRRGFAASDLPILQDAEVHWDGQAVAVVVAETLAQAEYAASLVEVRYQQEPAKTSFAARKATALPPDQILGEPPDLEIGDAGKALAKAAFTVDQVYRTPWQNHNALELHATIAAWQGDDAVTVFDTTQFINGYKHLLAEVFALDADAVRLVAGFVGGGFGGKLAFWTNTVLCVAAAKVVHRPVKLVLSREGVYRLIGGRSLTEQRVELGATTEGLLTALRHTGLSITPRHARYAEQFSFPSRHLYAAKNLFVGQRVVDLDVVANSWMRAPGEAVGTFALECAIDELAFDLGLDPIELRRRNEPAKDPTEGTEFSSRHLLETFRRGAERFRWQERDPRPRSQREGRWLVGQGVATAYYPVYRFPAKVRLRLSADGSVRVQGVANEIGGGAATVQLQHVADRLAVPIAMVSFQYGDSRFPDSAIMAGGSSQTASIAAAIQAAAGKLHRRLLDLAKKERGSPLSGASYDDVEARDAGLFWRGHSGRGLSYRAILTAAGKDHLETVAAASPPLEVLQYSMASYGAQFCEVRVHELTGELRVARWLGSFDCGRIVNPKTATSQLRGGIVMGIGMALAEETIFDERRGRIVNPSLAEYHVPVNLDIPDIEVIYTDIPDPRAPLGVRGVGEIGVTGAAAAVANAVFHATGKRVRDLPITLDKLM